MPSAVSEAKDGGEQPEHFAVFTDGSEKAHGAYLAVKALATFARGDTLTVGTIESDKNYLSSNLTAKAIRARYEAELVSFAPSGHHAFVSLPKHDQAAHEIASFADPRNKRLDQFRRFPAPTFVAVGFSGRKSCDDRDPSVVGQTADLSLRLISRPVILVKRPVALTPKPRHLVLVVQQTRQCELAATIFVRLLRPQDRLTLCYSTPYDLSEHEKQVLEEQYAKRFARLWQGNGEPFDFFAVPTGGHHTAIALQNALNDLPNFEDVDFVGVATPSSDEEVSRFDKVGSISSHLVRHYYGNIVLIGVH